MNAAVRDLETKERYRVCANTIAPLAEGAVAVTLAPADGDALPAFEAGAHIELFLPNGLARCYSLFNPLERSGHYKIAVQKDRASRGGSAYICHALTTETELIVSAPRNNFALVEAPHIRLIAGGIGITPLWAMAQVLAARTASWELFYAARSRQCAAFIKDLQNLGPVAVTAYFDDEHGGRPPALDALVTAAAPSGTHFYCCGPAPMMRAFETATLSLPRERVHTEYFTAKEDAARTGGFTVELARSGRTLVVEPGQTILDALIAARMNVRFMCTEGVCGECETRVLAGKPEHRDSYLTDEERQGNKVMMICCSGASSERLVLDL